MSNDNFRGVVLGSCWRLAYRFFQATNDGQLARAPQADMYYGQVWATEALLRRSLFYFDRIAWPTNNVLPQTDLPGLESLIDEGEVEPAHIEIPVPAHMLPFIQQMVRNPGFAFRGDLARTAAAVGEFHRAVFDRLNKQQPGKWNYASVGEGREFADEKVVRGYSTMLYNCLPVPLDSVPFEDILEFKKRERGALLDLRGNLDAAYRRIDSSGDKEFSLSAEIGALKKSIAAVQVLLNTSRLPWGLAALEVEYNPAAWVAAGLGGDDARKHLEEWAVPQPWPQIAGGILTAALLLKRKDIQLPAGGAFRYLYEAGLKGIVDKKNF